MNRRLPTAFILSMDAIANELRDQTGEEYSTSGRTHITYGEQFPMYMCTPLTCHLIQNTSISNYIKCVLG